MFEQLGRVFAGAAPALILAVGALTACARAPEEALADPRAPEEAPADPCLSAPEGQISVVAPWTRAQPTAGAVTGAYLTVCNRTAAPVRLVGAGAEIAAAIEIHETSKDASGVVSMRRVGDLTIEPGEPLVLEPGGKHLMLLGLKTPISPGEVVSVDLRFQPETSLSAALAVRPTIDPAPVD
jgi:hypothetical protein